MKAVFALLLLVLALPTAVAEPLGLVLPTRNNAIFGSDLSAFYMYTDRNFEGKRSRPWTGGKYGFVRNQKRTSSGIVMTRFHEGVDIKPVRRDANGVPLDSVHSIMRGTVVHASADSSKSSYGRYIVIRHDTPDGPFFSLYAHLASVSARVGTKVAAGTPIGILGYSGVGLDRRRAHVHVELNLLLSERFPAWHDKHYDSPNHHGLYNGLNMAGIDIAGLYLRHRKNPSVSIREFIGRMSPYYSVAVPQRGELGLLRRYPWLGQGVNASSRPAAWKITFSRSGVPLSIAAHGRAVGAPTIVSVISTSVPHSYNTSGRLSGSGAKATLSTSGRRYLELVTGG